MQTAQAQGRVEREKGRSVPGASISLLSAADLFNVCSKHIQNPSKNADVSAESQREKTIINRSVQYTELH